MRNNRLSDYEPGWLLFLVERGIATREDALAAQRRVELDAYKEIERLTRSRRRKRRRRD